MKLSTFFLAVVVPTTTVYGFTVPTPNNNNNNNNLLATEDDASSSRRNFLSNVVVGSGVVASAVLGQPAISNAKSGAGYVLGNKDTVVGREIASFNDLVYNFKNTALDGGLDATKLNEPSVSFIEFGDRMRKGEVEFVEFLAPSGQVAYVTFKKDKKARKNDPGPKPIRIGQGYPTGGPNSWASPDYVIRSVVNFGVPYKFTVPALASAKYKKTSK